MARPQGGRAAAIFYSLGYPTPYGPAWTPHETRLWQQAFFTLVAKYFLCLLLNVETIFFNFDKQEKKTI
jgi:hypothetical protein